ncbi:DUF4349 domain-containing protein [Streptomyces sp. FIT100]|uniref:DUF4349 domain-containing protein n=1 Tax=Streptomyces sp. FIT100 TaxID=2837956 RepID=UPI0021C63B8C|nr:DUF4349 domain-containing protein [Streptomyces sp. FIT100]UUN29830.1 DUF4349 domain-containing protein [Streptomyces sp. FIT100]
MRARRSALAAALLTASLSLALTGCGASESGTSADSKPAFAGRNDAAPEAAEKGAAGNNGAAADAGSAARPADGKQGEAAGKPLVTAHVIRTAELWVEVEDATKALAGVRTTVESAGGFVSEETTERVDDSRVTSRIVVRVPQDRYSSVLGAIAGSGKLLTRKSNAQDVTDQVVDVQSRIATQRASVARVRELMDRATQLSDVVTLEGELSRRQAELESLLAQQASLKDRTSLATITLELSEPEAEEAAESDNDPTFLDALKGGWEALVAGVRWLLVVLGAVMPFAAAAAVVYAVWRWLVLPWRRKSSSAAATAVPAPVAAPAAAPVPAQASAPGETGSGETGSGQE